MAMGSMASRGALAGAALALCLLLNALRTFPLAGVAVGGGGWLGGQLPPPRIDRRAYVVGCIRNSEEALRRRVQRNLDMLASVWGDTHFVVYADRGSADQWRRALGPRQDYEFIEQTFEHPERIRRLAHCRNVLLNRTLELMRQRGDAPEDSMLVLLDLDDMNSVPLSREVLARGLELIDKWEVLSFNRQYYYDIWALRYAETGFENIFRHHIPHLAGNVSEERLRLHSTYHVPLLPMIRRDISQRLQGRLRLFPVHSAFNGLALYKVEALLGCSYHFDERAPYELEHPGFHACIRRKGGRVRIYSGNLTTEYYRGSH